MPSAAPLFTTAARRHAARLRKAIAPLADRLDRQFSTWLRKQEYDELVSRAMLAILPSAAARLRSLDQFLEQVTYNGRRLAKCNAQPGEVRDALRQFDGLVEAALAGQYGPSREQIYLATVLALDRAYYQVREAEAQALYGIYQAEAEASGPKDMLRRVVGILTRSMRARAGRLLLAEEPLAGRLARPLYIEHGGGDEGLIADPGMRKRYASYWSYPLHASAAIQLGFATPYPWLPRELTLLAAAAERCQEALARAALGAEVRRLEDGARRAEEEERRRIGRELHDETGQLLLLLRLQLEMMERGAEGELRSQLAEARGIAERTVGELRRIIAALSPALLERLGLTRALRQLAARGEKLSAMEVRARISGGVDGLPRQVQELAYRVAQESLQNVAKHSHATHVNLSLRADDKVLRLRITDNGTGFHLEAAARKPMSFGLAGMRERTALLGGRLTIGSAVKGSAAKKGTCVVLDLPLDSALVKINGKDSRTVN